MTLHVAVATTMALKKKPADPTRSGTSSGKGKGRAHQPSPTPELSDDPEEPEFYAPPDLSDDNFPPLPAPPPKQESKRARRERLEQEAENDYAAFEARRHAQQAPASQEEIDRLLACQPPQIEVPGPPAPRADSSSASCPTLLWSENSEQYLQVPSHGGTSSGASSRASKRCRSPSPSSRKDQPLCVPQPRKPPLYQATPRSNASPLPRTRGGNPQPPNGARATPRLRSSRPRNHSTIGTSTGGRATTRLRRRAGPSRPRTTLHHLEGTLSPKVLS